MRILHRYIFSALFSTFLMSLLVLSFVMMVGLLFKATGYIASGASFDTVLRFLGLGFPGTLSLSVPISALVSTLLVFNRLSSDSETSAMRACGVSMRRIMLTPFLLGIALSALCFHVTGTVSPNSSYARRTIRKIVKKSDVLALLQPGKAIMGIPGMPQGSSIFIREREGDLLLDVRIQEPIKEGGVRDTRAKEARVFQRSNGTVRLELKEAFVSPLPNGLPGGKFDESLNYYIGDEIDAPDALPPKRIKDLVSSDLQDAIRANARDAEDTATRLANNGIHIQEQEAALREARAQLALQPPPPPPADGEEAPVSELQLEVDDLLAELRHRDALEKDLRSHLDYLRKEASKMRTEASNRIVLALASLCFIALAAPYGLKSSRRESSAGNALCIGFGLLYYVVLITADSLAKYPGCQPHLIAWIPVALCFVLSIRGIRKNT